MEYLVKKGSNVSLCLLGAWGLVFFSLKITIEAMKSDIDEVALQGIEFWSNVCDEEMDLAIEASEVSAGEGRESCPLPGHLEGLLVGAEGHLLVEILAFY